MTNNIGDHDRMNKTTIAIYLGNKDIENADFSSVELGNPGVGYSEFFPVALTYYLSRDHFGDFDYVLLAQNINKMPETISYVQVADIVDAAQQAKKMGAAVFVFRTRMKEEQGILDVIESLELKSIGVAQLTPFPDHIDKLSKTKYLRALVCVGREQYDSLLDTNIISKLAVINNAVDITCYPIRPLAERDPKLVVYMGALTYQKGFHMLAMAWPSVIKSVPDARLHVIGSTKMYGESRPVGRFGVSDPDYEEKYITKYLTDKSGALHPSVTLCGQLGIEKNLLISKSLVGIANPSGQTETCCVSAVEFSASGVAVVSGAYYALLNTIKHKTTGLLGKDIRDLSANIINLLSNPEFAVKLGESGRMYVKNEFSFASITPQWIGLFRAVISNQGVSKPSAKVNNFFKHKKYLRIINSYIRFVLPKAMQWPSVYHIESWVGSALRALRKIIPNLKKAIK